MKLQETKKMDNKKKKKFMNNYLFFYLNKEILLPEPIK